MRKHERLAGSKAHRLRFEAEKPRPPSMLRHTESAADALSDLLADAVLPADETEEKENVGVQAVRTGRQGAESSVRRMSKQRQKKQIQRQYAAVQTGRQAEGIVVQGAGEAVFTPVQRTERKIEEFIRKNRGKLVILLFAVMMTYMLSSLSGCMPIAQSLVFIGAVSGGNRVQNRDELQAPGAENRRVSVHGGWNGGVQLSGAGRGAAGRAGAAP